MKNIFDVLKQKEDELKQLQNEVEALRIAARLLADDPGMPVVHTTPQPTPQTVVQPQMAQPQAKPTPVFATAGAARSTPAANGAYSAAWGNAPRQFP